MNTTRGKLRRKNRELSFKEINIPIYENKKFVYDKWMTVNNDTMATEYNVTVPKCFYSFCDILIEIAHRKCAYDLDNVRDTGKCRKKK